MNTKEEIKKLSDIIDNLNTRIEELEKKSNISEKITFRNFYFNTFNRNFLPEYILNAFEDEINKETKKTKKSWYDDFVSASVNNSLINALNGQEAYILNERQAIRNAITEETKKQENKDNEKIHFLQDLLDHFFIRNFQDSNSQSILDNFDFNVCVNYILKTDISKSDKDRFDIETGLMKDAVTGFKNIRLLEKADTYQIGNLVFYKLPDYEYLAEGHFHYEMVFAIQRSCE